MTSLYDLRQKPVPSAAKGKASRRVSLEMPESLRHGNDLDTDVTAPKTNDPRYQHRSFFDLITNAGSLIDLNTRNTHDELSDGEDEVEAKTAGPSPDGSRKSGEGARHRRGLSDNKILRSILKPRPTSAKERRDASATDMMSSSQILPGKPADEAQAEPVHASTPDIRRLFRDHAAMEASALGSDLRRAQNAFGVDASSGPNRTGALAQRIKEVFQLEEEEEVLADWPCWLLQSVMLQGTLYITEKHICFYAYLPKKSHEAVKSGHLSKRGTSRWNRRWFVLKGDVLAYYNDRNDVYFPRGRINLLYGISAELTELKDNTKEALDFTVKTKDNTYYLRADSATAAKEWVKQLQKAIFKAHNDGNSVKISLAIDNILDIEDNPILGHTETIKFRVMDNDDSYAVDDYFFSFFGYGQEAMSVMQRMVEESKNRRASEAQNLDDLVGGKHQSLPTDANGGSSQSSFDRYQQHSGGDGTCDLSIFGRGRLRPERTQDSDDGEGVRLHSPRRPRDSYGSAAFSLEHDAESSAAVQSINDTEASASQILNKSDVFYRPSTGEANFHSSSSSVDRHGRDSQDTARSVDMATQESKTGQTSRARGFRTPMQESKGLGEDSEMQHDKMQASSSSFGLKGLVNAGAYPIQKASGLAGFLQNRSKQMNNLITSKSMSYYEKVSGMWAGGKKHYTTDPSLPPDSQQHDMVDDEQAMIDDGNFREHFSLPTSEKLQASFFGSIYKVLPLYGKIYLSNRFFCFRSLLIGTRTKLVLPLSDIENVEKENGFRLGYTGLVIAIRGHEELFFEFSDIDVRDDCNVTLHQILDNVRYLQSDPLSQESILGAEAAKAEHELLQQAHPNDAAKYELKPSVNVEELGMPYITTLPLSKTADHEGPSVNFDDPNASILEFKPAKSLHITCMAVGSRGDVQPYIALCVRLMQDGHRTRIVTHEEFGDWVTKNGIEFAAIGGNPADLMNLCVEHGMFTPSFMAESLRSFMPWLTELLRSAWSACQGTDVLIESPSTMAGIHIAEALQIPYFRAFTMPWTRTRAYPHSFAVPKQKLGGTYNFLSYVIFEEAWWMAISIPINRWRRQMLGLRGTTLKKMHINKIPFMYNFSPSVVPPPLDYSDWTHVTGYWFLDEGDNYQPPEDLAKFIARAREDGKKLVYIGFGSIPIQEDPKLVLQTIVDAVKKADVRCIFSKGWLERGMRDKIKRGEVVHDVPLPPEIFQIQHCPHDWLFKQVDAVAHHGGSGTTGASLRAGVPTIIKPFFGDQFFFAQRVKDLGVGVHLAKLNTTSLGRALWQASCDERMQTKAKELGEKIRCENGVENAVKALYRDMDYARSLIKVHGTHAQGDMTDEDDEPDEEWTFIEGENNPDITRRLADMGSSAANARAQWRELQKLQQQDLRREEERMLNSALLQSESATRSPSTSS